MSLKHTPNRNNSIGLERRLANNQEKDCMVSYCYKTRKGFGGYCKEHDYRKDNFGDPKQFPIKLRGSYKPYYEAVLSYIEEHSEELSEALELASKIIKVPELIRNHSMDSVEQWLKPNNYKEKGYLVSDKFIKGLYRWKRDKYESKHFLAAIIAHHVMSYQDHDLLISGKPVQMLISRSLFSHCRKATEWTEVSSLKFKKKYKSNSGVSRQYPWWT